MHTQTHARTETSLNTFACHEVGKGKLPFNDNEYSRFKYGSKSIARKFGKELADAFYKSELFLLNRHLFSGDNYCVVVPSPYYFIPTATFAMKDYFIARMNHYLAQEGLNALQETKCFRKSTYNDDYGSMSAEQRVKAIGSESFHVDVEFVKNKAIIFMDDIRITGSHEQRVEEMIVRQSLDAKGCKSMFLYYAQLVDKDTHPDIENKLNHAFVKDLYSIDKIIKNEQFIFNTRSVKYILKAPETEFRTFIIYQSDSFCETLYSCAIGNEYHKVDQFKSNFEFLADIVETKPCIIN